MNETTVTQTTPEPSVVTASCYFWRPGGTARARRDNEERNQARVARWFESLGLQVERHGDHVIGTGFGIEADFHYAETCGNVYRSLSVTRNGKRSNVTSLRKLAAC